MAQPPKRPDIDVWMEERNRVAGAGRGGGARPPSPVAPPAAAPRQKAAQAAPPRTSSVGHPGFAESLIPVWGSGREAIAEWEEGDYVSVLINAGLAASDLFLVGAIRNGISKGLIKKGPMGWSVAREFLKKEGWIKPGHEGHHVFIPQRGWGKTWPDALKNHPLNIKSLPKDVHRRITGRWQGQPRFNHLERLLHGAPAWTKVGIGGVGADAVQGLDERKR